MILVFGSINIDLVTPASAIPRPGETVLAERYDRWFGGKGANQAVAAARAMPAATVLMAGAVGDDALGRDARQNLEAQGVGTGCVAVTGLPTGCAFITVDPAGENAITVASGANRAAGSDSVPDAVLRAVTTLILQMEVPVAENVAIARRAAALGVRVILNLAPAPDRDAGPAEAPVDTLLGLTDCLVVNEHEALAANPPTGEAADALAAAAGLARQYGIVVVVTLGADGAAVASADGGTVRVAAPRIDPVDTTGAGDTFVGILAAGLDGGMPMADAMLLACNGAALACLYRGAQPGLPTGVPLC